MTPDPFFHQESEAVRFWVPINGQLMGASISRSTLHHRFRPGAQGDDPMDTFRTYAREITAAAERRVALGSIEPVMLREFDLREPAATDAAPRS